MHSFLFELGTEELPDNVILPALESIENSFRKMLQEYNIESGRVKSTCTPRRLSLMAEGLPEKQTDQEILKTGPAVSIAFNAEGELSPAGNGFLKKLGATREDTFIEHNGKGDFLAVRFTQKGKSILELLQTWIPGTIGQIPLPKKMIWEKHDLAFSRPIRWILALWDNEEIGLDYFGIKASRLSYGNRYLGLDQPILIQDCASYEQSLMEARVVVDHRLRKTMIMEQMQQLFAEDSLVVGEDSRLLDTVNNLIEYPTAVVGSFPEHFLDLPEKIISSTISQNQKYFSVYDAQGKLSNRFVFISNGDPDHSAMIRSGNEKVVRARLEDALWFYSEDCKHSLESYVGGLKDVVFQSKLGTLAEKTERLQKISTFIAQKLALSPDAEQRAMRTALLCKADLVTLMLGEKEFTKLQGYMGKQYALASGEDEEVAEGIYEHYMPRGSNDSLPGSLSGAICAVADKLDTVIGIIGVGMMPTGSADPFALRRAASGVVQIMADRKWNLDLWELIDYCLGLLKVTVQLCEDAQSNITSFFAQRVAWLLKEFGIAYDVVSAVMHTKYRSLDDLIARARALDALKKDESFIHLVIGFKRAANIIAGTSSFAELDPDKLESGAEQDLFNGLQSLHQEVSQSLKHLDYVLALQKLVNFGKIIDRFFDDVLVNCEDTGLRANRYALLERVRAEFLRVADLSLIVVENEIIGE
ncbi:MAG: glycine--tRNA ligase subunit beta [Candidatus Cloacimonadaceae bacterium]|nr:glycine--tRNA ligase subunit beta [Candidatus Cloacimonadota bacterium]